MDGPGLDDQTLNSLMLLFPQGPPDARVLLDDVEVTK